MDIDQMHCGFPYNKQRWEIYGKFKEDFVVLDDHAISRDDLHK